MSIPVLFGWNSYKIKEIFPSELGLTNPESEQTSFQYRQEYFHIFFIPFFPIGKKWVVKKDGKMYNPSVELHSVLSTIKMPKTGLGTLINWIGLIIILSIIIPTFGPNAVKNFTWGQSSTSGPEKKDIDELKDFFSDNSRFNNIVEQQEYFDSVADIIYGKNDYVLIGDAEAFENPKESPKFTEDLKNFFTFESMAKSSGKEPLKGYSSSNTYIYMTNCRNRTTA